jgi:hypothetical protein
MLAQKGHDMDWGWIGLGFVFVCLIAGLVLRIKEIKRTGMTGWTHNNAQIWAADASAREAERKAKALRAAQSDRPDQRDS